MCGCGDPLDFDMWRQMTVEHLIGRSQNGYIGQIRGAVAKRFPKLSSDEQENFSQRLDQANKVSACSFCNSTTSRDISEMSMTELLQKTRGTPEEVLQEIKRYLKKVLKKNKPKLGGNLPLLGKPLKMKFVQKSRILKTIIQAGRARERTLNEHLFLNDGSKRFSTWQTPLVEFAFLLFLPLLCHFG